MIDLSNYIGLEFQDHGHSMTGANCWGLIYLIYKNEFDIELPKYDKGYEKANIKNGASIEKLTLLEAAKWVHVDSPKFGDVLTFLIAGNRSHVGMTTSDHQMIHIIKGANSCIENYTRRYWEKREPIIYRHSKRM